jgi:signal transduction histidine kinase
MMNTQPIVETTKSNSETHSAGHTHLRGPWLAMARITWLLISLSAVGFLITALVWNTVAWWNFTEADCHDLTFLASINRSLEACVTDIRAHQQVFGTIHLVAVYYGLGAAVEMLPWVLVGALIFWRKSQEPFALFFSLGLVLAGVLSIDTVVREVIWEHFPVFKLLIRILGLFAGVLLVLWYRFPNGQFVPRRMRWIAIVWIGLVFFSFFLPGSLLDYDTWLRPLPQVIRIIFVLSLAFSLVYRYRHTSSQLERQQIRWVVVTGAIFGCVYAGSIPIMDWAWSHRGLADTALTFVIIKTSYLALIYIGSAVFAGGIGISILRYRLWDIDIIINRTLVYGGLTIIVIGIYVLIVGVLGTTIQGSGNLLISILATGLVAVLVQPLRDHLQRGVNRMMFGERDDPVTVLSRLGQQLEGTLAPDAVLPSLVETVAQTLKLPYVAIETKKEDRADLPPTTDASLSNVSDPTIAYGQPQPNLIRLPLIYQSETVGQLVVAPRAPSEPLSPMDRHLLENIAYQAGMAVHAVSLTADLQRSRQRLVTAREEERRRLRRDLHDGLGPNLASQGLKLAAVKQLLEKDPTSAAPLLEQVMTQNQSTVDEVRRLVYGLRPPALDELGLVPAIRDYVAGMDGNAALHVEITQPPDGLPPLSAAVEVAAYRIVLEALTNVIRHAQAHHCAIRFSLSQNGSNAILQIEIVDDGIGLPRDLRAGVGLRSMRERAEEVAGTCVIEAVAGSGTRVSVRVPLIVV